MLVTLAVSSRPTNVAPGADPTAIRWQYTGVDQLAVDAATGDPHLTLPPVPTGALTPTTIVERAPGAWQDSDGVRVAVAAQYVIHDDRSVGFAVASYDPAIALTIDPEVVSGSFGGNGSMQARDLAIDSTTGRAYIAGSVYNGHNDGVLFTVNTTTLQQEDIFYFSRYVDDFARGVAVDREERVYVTGFTNSSYFLGSLEYHSGNCGDEYYAFPCYDIFALRMTQSPVGWNVDYLTLIGGASGDYADAIAVDANGDAYIGGSLDNASMAYAVRLHWSDEDSALSRVYEATYAGADTASAYGIAVDANQNAYLVGSTQQNSDEANEFYPSSNAFVVKLDADGTRQWQRVFGGTDAEYADAVAVDLQQRVYVAGYTASIDDFPTISPLPTSYVGGGGEGGYQIGFATMLTSGGATTYRTVLAGDAGNDIAVDSTGRVFIASGRYDEDAGTVGALITIAPNGAAWGDEQLFATSELKAVALDASENSYVMANGYLARVGNNPSLDVDTDGDALPDYWEQNQGYWYTGDGENTFVALPDADPNHKDVYIEIDYMGEDDSCTGPSKCYTHDHRPDSKALALVVRAFADAPVDNPDNQQGVNLHIEVDDKLPHVGPVEGGKDYITQADWEYFLDAMDNTRRPAYHHAIFVHAIGESDNTLSGVTPRKDDGRSTIYVSLGNWARQTGDVYQQAGTFMHELGHELGLSHGGSVKKGIELDDPQEVGDDNAWKPNHLSVMAYGYQMGRLFKVSGSKTEQVIDYSRFSLPTLREEALDEQAGIGIDGYKLPPY